MFNMRFCLFALLTLQALTSACGTKFKAGEDDQAALKRRYNFVAPDRDLKVTGSGEDIQLNKLYTKNVQSITIRYLYTPTEDQTVNFVQFKSKFTGCGAATKAAVASLMTIEDQTEELVQGIDLPSATLDLKAKQPYAIKLEIKSNSVCDSLQYDFAVKL